MTERIQCGELQVAKELDTLLREEITPGIDIDPGSFWSSFESILNRFSDQNKILLNKREELQSQIDQWHIKRRDDPFKLGEYKDFLKEINYLVEEGDDFEITTSNVDQEIKGIAGPQLVVPVMNARFSLNAANARWGSLYDALYGTDVYQKRMDLKEEELIIKKEVIKSLNSLRIF